MSRVQQVVVGSVIAGIVGGLVIAGIVGFAMAGILPQVQGCWQDEQPRETRVPYPMPSFRTD